jgi:hypothetical protein
MVFLWLLLQFILTVQRDVQQRILEHSMGMVTLRRATPAILICPRDVVQEIKACSVLYKNNFCEGNIVPHMFQPCGEWETCMNRDPSKIGRARIGAQLLAEIVNAFVENISWKTFVSVLVTFAFIRRLCLIKFSPVLLRGLARVFHTLHKLHIYILSIETVSRTAPNTLTNTPTTVCDATPDTTTRQVWYQVETRGRRRRHWDTDKAKTAR